MKALSQKKRLEFYSADVSSEIEIPFFKGGVKAGFPSPAEDFDGSKIDLNKELITNSASTFFAKVNGKSMEGEGLFDGDILVVDKSIETANGKIAVCFLDGEFTVKRIKKEGENVWLIPANKDFSPIRVTPDNNFVVWGVVTFVIKRV